VALACAIAASVATSPPHGRDEPIEPALWRLNALDARTIDWDRILAGSVLESATVESSVVLAVEAPRGTWKLDIGLYAGVAGLGSCEAPHDDDVDMRLLALWPDLDAATFGDFAVRCLGPCTPSSEGKLELRCDRALCRASVNVPVQGIKFFLRSGLVTPTCASATFVGPLRERGHDDPPEGLVLAVSLASWALAMEPTDAGATDAAP
jgi:hypothetical protein